MKYFLFLLLLSATSFHAIGDDLASSKNAEKQMNVVFILADDLGWSDTELYGTTRLYKTPNILRLAERGCTFTRAYSNSPLCSPTRASILAGQSPARHGSLAPAHHKPQVLMKPAVVKNGPASNKALGVRSVTRLGTEFATLGKLMKQAAYQTAHIGKWDLGNMQQVPLNIGFRETNKSPPKKKYTQGELESIRGISKVFANVPEKQLRYICLNEEGEEQLLIEYEGQQIVEFLNREHTAPFFMYISPLAVHGPNIEMPKHLLDRVPDDVKGARRFLAACIMAIDDQLGQILEVLEKKGIRDNTFFVFASDNGADPKEGGTSTPFAGGKGGGTQKEGWVRTPAIFSQPGVLPEGKVYDGMICSLDLYATFAALSGKDAPKHLDGVNLIPHFQGKANGDPHEFLFWLNKDPDDPPHRHLVAVRWRNWRLYKHEESDPWQLFDLKNDPKEEKNVATKFPNVVEKLGKEFSGWRETLPQWKPMPDRVNGIPIPKGHGWTSLSQMEKAGG